MCIKQMQFNDQLCQDTAFLYEKQCQDQDINRLHRQMIGGGNQYMKGDVTFMDTNIRFRQLLNDYNAETGLVKHKAYLTIESISAMHAKKIPVASRIQLH